jgi:magnesium-transporting ATPase (P-type)
MSSSKFEDVVENEKDDVVASQLFTVPETAVGTTGSDAPSRGNRKKSNSDISKMALAQCLPETTTKATESRVRQKSSTDSVTMFGNVPALNYDDLKLAENVSNFGTARERQASNAISEKEFFDKVEEDEGLKDFEYNHVGLTSEEAEKRLAIYGRNDLPEKVDPKWLIFLRQFWAPMPIMIWLAIIIEIGIGNYLDMGILLLIQFANASISFYEITKAGNAIAALKSSLKPLATCKRDGKFKEMDAALLVPGDLVLLASGSAIPADCRVNHGEIDVDQAALTGESLPVTFYKGDSCKMGSTVVRGEVEVRITFRLRLF